MSMQDYESAVQNMAPFPQLIDFVGPRPESLIQKAEQTLGFRFPPTYRRFVAEYGAGSFGAEEIRGLINEAFETAGALNTVWSTLRTRRNPDFPRHYLVIYSVGNGEIFCLAIGSGAEGEAKVVAVQPGMSALVDRHEVIAEDFGACFLQLVQQELDFNASYHDEEASALSPTETSPQNEPADSPVERLLSLPLEEARRKVFASMPANPNFVLERSAPDQIVPPQAPPGLASLFQRYRSIRWVGGLGWVDLGKWRAAEDVVEGYLIGEDQGASLLVVAGKEPVYLRHEGRVGPGFASIFHWLLWLLVLVEEPPYSLSHDA